MVVTVSIPFYHKPLKLENWKIRQEQEENKHPKNDNLEHSIVNMLTKKQVQ